MEQRESSNIPIFIICRDRLTPLADLITWLESHDYHRIILIDNASTYPPLLEFLEATRHEVVRLSENMGPRASIWETGVLDRYAKRQHYVVTDCDVVPDEGCPGDAVDYFLWALRRFPRYTKAGFGLRIDNLPSYYDLAQNVRDWERRYWLRRLTRNLYHAWIDTTFALYRPDSGFSSGPGIRTGAPYLACHYPWYVDSSRRTEEEQYYRDHCRQDTAHWDLSGHEQHLSHYSMSLVEKARWHAHRLLRVRSDPSVPRKYKESR